jgi:hypothetical protein
MLKIDNLKQALNDFSNNIVKDAKANLESTGKVDTGQLKNSLVNQGAKVSKNSIEINILMSKYGAFVDKGVRGVGGVRKQTSAFKRTNNKGKIWKQNGGDSPYSFKVGKKPSVKHFIDWSNKRGLSPFAVRESVYHQGIKPTYFLRDAVQDNIKLVPNEIAEAFALDVKSTIELIAKSNFK